jgi:hypothetical protein
MARTSCWLTVCALIVAVHRPAPAVAQDATARRDSALARLKTGQQIRISGEAMSRLIGKAGVASNDTLDFAQDDAVRRIPVQAIDTLWVRGRATSTGMLYGGVLGGLAGALAGASAESSEGGDVALVGAAGALAGVAVGALVGAAFPEWKRKYP